jgi:release factor glutamine methyltransferase
MTLNGALAHGAGLIGKREAKLLLSHVTGYSASGLVLHAPGEISAAEYALYTECIGRRQTGEPLQYIIGAWEFMGFPFLTDPRALIPRPETELLVEEANKKKKKDFNILDVCTGSGCIAIALAKLLGENASITATDISAAALELARENAAKNQLAPKRVNFIETDLLEGLPQNAFDVIISNPPYISSDEMEVLSPTVRDHEPHLALHGGEDGLDIYRRLIPQAKNALRKGGALFLEIGPPAVSDLMASVGFQNIKLQNDYAELPRIVTGRVCS